MQFGDCCDDYEEICRKELFTEQAPFPVLFLSGIFQNISQHVPIFQWVSPAHVKEDVVII